MDTMFILNFKNYLSKHVKTLSFIIGYSISRRMFEYIYVWQDKNGYKNDKYNKRHFKDQISKSER